MRTLKQENIIQKGTLMNTEYKIVYEGGEGEITEKKSRFIATVFPIETAEQALEYIEQTKKKYWDARHNCYAYVLGDHYETQRMSDDGEPGGTAGKPMLDVLMGEELHNVLVVVTRYFGGTLLETGGLVRAYQGATKEGLSHSTIITKHYGCFLNITTDYNGLGKIQYILGQRGLTILDSEYGEEVLVKVIIPMEEKGSVMAEIIEGTNGKAVMEEGEECWFASINGEMKIL